MPRIQSCDNPPCGNTFRHGFPGERETTCNRLYCSVQCMFEHGLAIGGRISKKMAKTGRWAKTGSRITAKAS